MYLLSILRWENIYIPLHFTLQKNRNMIIFLDIFVVLSFFHYPISNSIDTVKNVNSSVYKNAITMALFMLTVFEGIG